MTRGGAIFPEWGVELAHLLEYPVRGRTSHPRANKGETNSGQHGSNDSVVPWATDITTDCRHSRTMGPYHMAPAALQTTQICMPLQQHDLGHQHGPRSPTRWSYYTKMARDDLPNPGHLSGFQ